MGPLPSLVQYACIANVTVILTEFCCDDPELSALASKWLQKIPPYHKRFSHTANRRMFVCLIENPFVYCAIVDEALGKAKAYSFLDEVKGELKTLLTVRGLASDVETLESHSLDKDFIPIFRHLITPLVGIPQKDYMEKDNLSQQETPVDHEIFSPAAVVPSSNGNEDKRTVKDQLKEVREIMIENNGKAMDRGQTLEIILDRGSQPVQDPESRGVDGDGQQLAKKMWWRNVRLVLMLDVAVCVVLFVIWLGICRGISCIKS